MPRTDYHVTISEASRPLTAKEKIAYKDTTDAISIDKLTSEHGTVVVKIVAWAILSVHNEKSDDKDYYQYLLIADDGAKYITGSQSLFDSFIDIWEDMEEEPDTDWSIKMYRLPSKNFAGRDFITCSIV